MTACTRKTLYNFGRKHYTFINQIFGDESVRDIISELYPNKDYRFEVTATNNSFVNHHYLYKVKYDDDGNEIEDAGENICSIREGYQNIKKNKNDTLCQSYSLLTFLGYKIDKNMSRNDIQRVMCEMYQEIIENKDFIDKMKIEVLSNPENSRRFKNYTKESAPFIRIKQFQEHDKKFEFLFRNIRDVLVKWQDYGYLFFTGKGLPA